MGALQRPVVRRGVCGPRFGDDVLAFFEECGLASGPRRRAGVSTRSRDRRPRCARCCSRGRRGPGVVLAPAREVACVERDGDVWRVTYEGASSSSVVARSAVLAAGGGEGVTRSLDLRARRMSPCSARSRARRRRTSRSRGSTGAGRTWSARLLRGDVEVACEVARCCSGRTASLASWCLTSRGKRGPGTWSRSTSHAGSTATGRGRSSPPRAAARGALDPVIAGALGSDALERAFDLRFVVTGPAEPERAQVTRGGLLTERFDPATLEARELPGLFACGEALNVDGACGGFNLAWAWKSGLVAGRAAAGRRAADDGAGRA